MKKLTNKCGNTREVSVNTRPYFARASALCPSAFSYRLIATTSKLKFILQTLLTLCVLCLLLVSTSAQSGRRSAQTRGESGSVINVFASRDDDSKEAITQKNIALYENGVELTIKSFVMDPSPSRIVLLVDNSLTLRADVQKLEEAAKEFAYEIYEGDQLMVVGYDDNAEIVTDWTDDAKTVEATLKSFRKKGSPRLFDALSAVLNEALQPVRVSNRKLAIVVIGDGLDRGSQTKFKDVLADLQKNDVAVYSLQLPDRTGGAIQRNQPKPAQVIEKLTEGTGGLVFEIKEARKAAAKICEELRKNRYLLSYQSGNFSLLDDRRLLIIADHGISIRSKTVQPAIAPQ
jgi:VWFA-related protein